MILYRIVDKDYSSFYDAYSGFGSSKYGGRWNEVGIETIYVSTTIKSAVAEKSFYVILNKLSIYKNKKKLTRYEAKEILDVEYILVESDFNILKAQSQNFIDQNCLSSYLKAASLPNAKVSDSTLSPWQKLPGKWTSKLGGYLHQTKAEGCLALSARGANGKNYILYNDNFLLTQIKNFKKTEVYLSAADVKCEKKWSGKGKFSLDHVHFSVPSMGQAGIVRIKNQKI